MSEFELIIKKLEIVRDTEENGCYICDKEHSKILLDGINKQKEVLDKIRKNNERIIDYGFDYDGFNNVEDLKKLIDMLVDYARKNDELLEEIE